MERIKEAVERARSQRAGGEAAAAAATTPSAPEALERNIQYSETQVVEADARKLRNSKLITGIEDERLRAAFKMLRTQVEQRMRSNDWKACAVTCPTPEVDEAKTTVATNLAISLAWSMQRTVLLVDLNLRNPGVHKRFGVNEAPGVIDYLVNDVPLKDLLFNPGIDRMTVLPGGKATGQSSELLSSPKMGHLVRELKARYEDRIIIFDLPPILNSDDAMAFIPNADCSLLVVEDGETTQDEMLESLHVLEDDGFLGVCLNGALSD
jgi:capsular exopolysaccharide synthesis family protein